ncbi:XK-related protein 8-like [Coregonus clupeaformis]|uniref:XK-related protein 8-like n=1 Tax=Coregonus clupeaformis TaxID=59861 RepID=UPI001E1C5512|nr:XK-related protein 8-like [Coregonus clupeaformis]
MGLDACAVVSFYQEEAYVFMGLLVFLLLGSSALVQAFSWLWHHYDKEGTETRTESLVKNLCCLKILHVFQMGVYLRTMTQHTSRLSNLKSPQPLGKYGRKQLSNILNPRPRIAQGG